LALFNSASFAEPFL